MQPRSDAGQADPRVQARSTAPAHPDLVLLGWSPESDSDGPFGPGDGVPWHEFLDAVLPQDPSAHLGRNGWDPPRMPAADDRPRHQALAERLAPSSCRPNNALADLYNIKPSSPQDLILVGQLTETASQTLSCSLEGCATYPV